MTTRAVAAEADAVAAEEAEAGRKARAARLAEEAAKAARPPTPAEVLFSQIGHMLLNGLIGRIDRDLLRLFGQEAVERLVLVERSDHVVAIHANRLGDRLAHHLRA